MSTVVTDKDACPKLTAVIEELLPDERSFGGWRTSISSEASGMTINVLEPGIAEIARSEADTLVGAREVWALLTEVERHDHTEPERSLRLRGLIAEHVSKRWAVLAEPLARLALEDVHWTRMHQAFPKLRSDPAIVRAFASRLANDGHFYIWRASDVLAGIEISSVDQARTLIVAAMKRRRLSH
jgi:hypothetical protein